MKLLRFGEKDEERPGLLDANGVIRDLSQHIDDVDGRHLDLHSLKNLAALDVGELPEIEKKRPDRSLCRASGKIYRDRTKLFRSRKGDGFAYTGGTSGFL